MPGRWNGTVETGPIPVLCLYNARVHVCERTALAEWLHELHLMFDFEKGNELLSTRELPGHKDFFYVLEGTEGEKVKIIKHTVLSSRRKHE